MNDPIFEQYVSGVLKKALLTEMPVQWTKKGMPHDEYIKHIADTPGKEGKPKVRDYLGKIGGVINQDIEKGKPYTDNATGIDYVATVDTQDRLKGYKGFGTSALDGAVDQIRFLIVRTVIEGMKAWLEQHPNNTFPGTPNEFKQVVSQIVVKTFAELLHGTQDDPYFKISSSNAGYIARVITNILEDKTAQFLNITGEGKGKGSKEPSIETGTVDSSNLLAMLNNIKSKDIVDKMNVADIKPGKIEKGSAGKKDAGLNIFSAEDQEPSPEDAQEIDKDAEDLFK